ncbi:Transcriptional regulatory protein fixJ [Salmonella enterica subsp. enterica]|nr:Transcriptional regulatory protein fixJ [Salmonella enterica subsp. enterica]
MATIHLLDDDTAVTNACAFLLESLGYDVKCWTQGADFFGAGQSVSGRSRITGYANAGTGWAGRS